MENNSNGFLTIKALIAAVCGAFTAAFGWLGWLIVAWVACMALDWLSGSAAAASKGEWASAIARAGIWHKLGMIIVVGCCAQYRCSKPAHPGHHLRNSGSARSAGLVHFY